VVPVLFSGHNTIRIDRAPSYVKILITIFMQNNKGKVYFIFGVHNHQPAGNLSYIFDEAFKKCYLPFISLLEEFPAVKCTVHNTGCIYDHKSKESALFLDILKRLRRRGQVEIISGGYYEPVLSLISDEDKKGQISLMNSFIEKEFGRRPQGFWLAERVWQPDLAGVIKDCCLNYTFLDEVHFRLAGVSSAKIEGYYTTEEDNKPLFVFPINKILLYKVPFAEPGELIDALKSFQSEKDVLVTLFHDGEKFGLRPGTFERVYEKEWLKDFFSLLSKSDFIKTITPFEAVQRFASKGLRYFPCASYEKMQEWALEPREHHSYRSLKDFLRKHNKLNEYRDFIRGGEFRNFLARYPRLNYTHKRMFSFSTKVNEKASFKRNKDIFINLWKAQANCSYWHGLFGGFYLSHLRQAVWKHLIKAENLWDKKRRTGIAFERKDIDFDSSDEVILRNKKIICSFASKGGALKELSSRKREFNALSTITRIKESYHADSQAAFVSDSYERLGLMDHLLDKGLSVEDFSIGRGVDTLSRKEYDLAVRKHWQGISLDFNLKTQDLSFSKQVRFKNRPGFGACYRFERTQALNNRDFGIEFNLSLIPNNDFLVGPKDWGRRSSFEVLDSFKKVSLGFEFDKARVLTFPVYAYSSSESGLEKLYQQIAVLFVLDGQEGLFRLKVGME